MSNKAIVLFSGGQDSTTCLLWALSWYDYVETVGVYYGQKNVVELECRKNILAELKKNPIYADRLGEDHLLDFSVLGQISDTAMTRGTEIKIGENGIPNTFVPARNILFLTLASAVGYRRGIHNIITGVSQTDFSGYPDCRQNTMSSLEQTLTLGIGEEFKIITPLMKRTKAQTWELAESCGGLDGVELVRTKSHTCYNGDHSTFHEWGFGCGKCPACILREKGFNEYKESKK